MYRIVLDLVYVQSESQVTTRSSTGTQSACKQISFARSMDPEHKYTYLSTTKLGGATPHSHHSEALPTSPQLEPRPFLATFPSPPWRRHGY